MTYETEKVSELKDKIIEALNYNNVEDPDIIIDSIGLADAIGNHLVNTIFKDNEEYQINIDINDN